MTARIVLTLLLCFAGVAWLVFPILAISYFRELLRLTKQVEEHLRAMRRYYEPEKKVWKPAVDHTRQG